MAREGDRFEMVDGSVYLVVSPAAASDGEYVEMEFTLPAGSFAPPPHVHPAQVEEYEVIEGRFDVMVDGEWTSLAPARKELRGLHRELRGSAGRSECPRASRPSRADDHVDAVPQVSGHTRTGARSRTHSDGCARADRDAAAAADGPVTDRVAA
jgi:hypothetical protein